MLWIKLSDIISRKGNQVRFRFLDQEYFGVVKDEYDTDVLVEVLGIATDE